MKMKNSEKLAIAALAIYLISQLASSVGYPLIKYFSRNEELSYEMIMSLRTFIGVISFSINIAVAIWLYRVAKRERSVPWVWAMAGFIFGILAGVLFYGTKIYEKLKRLERAEHY